MSRISRVGYVFFVVILAAAVGWMAGCSREKKPAPARSSGTSAPSAGKAAGKGKSPSGSRPAGQPAAPSTTAETAPEPEETMPYRMCAMTRGVESGVQAAMWRQVKQLYRY